MLSGHPGASKSIRGLSLNDYLIISMLSSFCNREEKGPDRMGQAGDERKRAHVWQVIEKRYEAKTHDERDHLFVYDHCSVFCGKRTFQCGHGFERNGLFL